MGEHRDGKGGNFWRAGAAPVRPVRAIRGKEGSEQDTKEVKKSAVKEKKIVRFKEDQPEGEAEPGREQGERVINMPKR